MSEHQGGPPPGWPTPSAESFGPGRTIVGEPLFDGAGGDFPSAALPVAETKPTAPISGERRPAPTVVDQALDPASPTDVGAPPYSDVLGGSPAPYAAGAPMVPPTNIPEGATADPGQAPQLYAPSPVSGTAVMHGGVAPTQQPAYAPSPAASPYAPSPAASPYAQAPEVQGYAPPPLVAAQPKKSGGLSMIAIGAIAFVLIGGGVTTAFWLSTRTSSDEDDASEIPTIAVPAPVVLTGAPPMGEPSAGEAPPAVDVPPIVPQPGAATPPAAKPTAAPPPATPPPATKPPATPVPANTATGKPPPATPAPTTPSKPSGGGRAKIPTRN